MAEASSEAGCCAGAGTEAGCASGIGAGEETMAGVGQDAGETIGAELMVGGGDNILIPFLSLSCSSFSFLRCFFSSFFSSLASFSFSLSSSVCSVDGGIVAWVGRVVWTTGARVVSGGLVG